jgi:cytoskeleton protein RodZ
METLGRRLRLERERKQISLEELAQTTRIPLKMLQRLEDDRWDELAGDVYTRGYIKAYARVLGVDAEPWLADLGVARGGDSSPASLTAITAPERGGRFGITITIVILLILFTLALSIMLGTRERGTQNELSFRGYPCPSVLDSLTPSCCAPSTIEMPTRLSRC